MFFDTHAHLNDAQFDADREAVLLRAQSRGVTQIVEIADSPADWDKAIALSRSRPDQVRCSLGLHPYHANQWDAGLLPALKDKSRLPEVVAVGEIGLDYAKCDIPPEIQKKSLLEMLAAAEIAELPVVLHCREAYADMMPLLRGFYAARPTEPLGEEVPPPHAVRARPIAGRFRGVIHCFSGDPQDARAAAELGFALGVDGPVTYPKNNALRGALRAAGLQRLVLETDSPYLPPQSSRGKRNEPAAIPEIAAKLAELFNVAREEVAAVTTRNARDLFRM